MINNLLYLLCLFTFSMSKSFQTLMPDSVAPSLHAKCDKPSELGFNIMKDKTEVWLDIPNTGSAYQISNFGRIISWLKKGTRVKERTRTPTYLKSCINTNGYPHFSISVLNPNRILTFRIHRLVAELFVPNPFNYPMVLHIDDNKQNCHFSNLKWGTSAHNNIDAIIKGINVHAKGEKSNKSHLKESDVLYIFNSNEGCRELGRRYNVGHGCISNIRTGKSWNHVTGLLCTRKRKAIYSKDIKYA